MTAVKTVLREGRLELRFPPRWKATKYDDWPFYQNRFKDACCGNKAVDVVVLDPDGTLWLVEVKDYRHHSRTKDILLWDEIALKVRDTLAGLVAAMIAGDHPDQAQARQALRAGKLRVVLHLEQPLKHSRLFPRIFDPEKIRQKLRQLIKPIDAHPIVVELHNMHGLAWIVASRS
jgi:hypothetical protein